MKSAIRLSMYALLCWGTLFAQPGREVILQGFYWNTHPGDVTTNQGLWWDTLATVASQLAEDGFYTVWVPPPSKGSAGVQDMGYGLYDYYDLGQFNQKGSTRSRFGNKTQLLNMISALHNAGLKVMVDVVLNHRGGADAQQFEDCDDGDGKQLRWTAFNPLSHRLPGDSTDFHPNTWHCDLNPNYHNRIFFEDVCYFHGLDNALDGGAPNSGWYFGPHNLGHMGDSLVVWGRWLIQTLGFDAVRLDAAKHIEPGFMAPFLVELVNGNQPFAVAEFFDEDMALVKSWHDDVEAFVSTWGTGSKNANIAMFDFNLRSALRDMCNNTTGTFDMSTLNSRGLRFSTNPLNGDDIVTFVENHDKDRIGWVVVNCSDPHDTQFGNTCLKLSTDSGHDPIFSDKHMAYAYIMAAEGRPSVFWKDYFWFHLDDEIRWLMALRRWFATGSSSPLDQLNPYFASGSAGDFFAFIRSGSGGGTDGCVLALNDHPTDQQEVWLNTPFVNQELKDYSDSYLFTTTEAFADSRTLIRVKARNFAWYAPTGLYPHPPGIDGSKFTLSATPGQKLHFVALRASDAASFVVNGAPIQPGDEIAIMPLSATQPDQAVGIGRIGQRFRWDGTHDMLIEVLGGSTSAGGTSGLMEGEGWKLVVYDSSQQNYMVAGSIMFAPHSTVFNFVPDRPTASGGNTPVSQTVNHAQATYKIGGISLTTGFNASDISLPVTLTGFTARWDGLGLTLSWRTESEVNNLGFEIWRAEGLDGPFVLLAD
ncbi:MAG: hypothetical protein D6715_03450, partial [Calditrichaeota bacterium]